MYTHHHKSCCSLYHSYLRMSDIIERSSSGVAVWCVYWGFSFSNLSLYFGKMCIYVIHDVNNWEQAPIIINTIILPCKIKWIQSLQATIEYLLSSWRIIHLGNGFIHFLICITKCYNSSLPTRSDGIPSISSKFFLFHYCSCKATLDSSYSS